MRKALHENNLEKRVGVGAVAAVSLSFALAVFGCTTNKMPGNGQPGMAGPGYDGSPATTSVPGTSSGSEPVNHLVAAGPAGMTSAQLDAITTIAADRAFQGRVLGSSDPGPNPLAGTQLAPTGQYIPPSLSANPESTVNSSISSAPTPVITTGADVATDAGIFFATAAAAAPGVVGAPGTGAGVTAPMTNVGSGIVTPGLVSPVIAPPVNGATLAATNVGIAGAAQSTATSGALINPAVAPSPVLVAPASGVATTAAPVFTTPATVANPTNTANVLVPGAFAAGPGGGTALAGNRGDVAQSPVNPGPLPLANGTVLGNGNTGTLNPTMTSALTPSPTVAANPPVVVNNNQLGVATRTTPATGGGTIATASGALTIGGGSANTAASAIRTAGANAAITLTNSGMTSASTTTNISTLRTRAARAASASTTAPATISSRGRTVRITTAPNGAVVLTNTPVKDNQTFMKRLRAVSTPQQ